MNQLIEMIEKADSIGICGHIRPDGDCTGSCLGLYQYIKDNYKDKKLNVYMDEFSESFQFLSGSGEVLHEVSDDIVYDLFISLDCGDRERIGCGRELFLKARNTLCIDHHISNTGYGNINIVEPDKSSTCEVLFTLLNEEDITKETAEAIYLGIVHDTGVFKHSSTSGETMNIAGRLMEKGAASYEIIDHTFYQKTYIQNQILGRCLLESILLLDGRVIASCVDKKTLDFYEAKPADLDGVIDQLRVTKGVEAAILAYETDFKEYKVSMRSNGKVDVSKIAVYFGGGGHIKAAGCTMKGSHRDAITNLLRHIESQLLNPEE